MQTTRVKNRKTGQRGWRFRFMDPATGQRRRKTFWYAERSDAERAYVKFLDRRQAIADGLPETRGWRTPYTELVARFLKEAPITTERRRAHLKRILERNELRLQTGADLAHRGRLSARCQKLREARSSHYVVFSIQAPLKQLARWAAEVTLFPFDPLAGWKRLPWGGTQRTRHAFTPEEIAGILRASEEYDTLLLRPHPSTIVYLTLLLTGNRPSAVLGATVGDFDAERARLHLPAGQGNKRNGAALLPPAFVPILREYLKIRGRLPADAPLLVSPEGAAPDRLNIGDDFRRALVLHKVRELWPAELDATQDAEPAEVAYRIYYNKPRGFDGRKPTDPAKVAARKRKLAAVDLLAERLGPDVKRWLIGRDMYALRKTHISWARRLANPDAVREQVGHAPRDIEEKHYLDLVDPRESALAVWDVLTGARSLYPNRAEKTRQAPPEALAKAAGAEGQTFQDGEAIGTDAAGAPHDGGAARSGDILGSDLATLNKNAPAEGAFIAAKSCAVNGIPGRIRTSDLNLRRVALYPG
ncbi:MAG: hypothetical protein AMXMBFR7_16360 [Planctomycetota bacterium]